MFARFFIERPVFATIISVVIVLFGAAAFKLLPIAQYPEITPPTVQVNCSYAGADARVVQETVAAPIEQQVNGVENMLYMSSQCTNDGGYSLTVTFKLGTDLNMAQVLVQNRVNQALPTLPDVVKATGVTTLKKSPAILLVVNLYSDNDPDTGLPFFDQLYLSNYATIQIKDQLARLDGVGDVTFLGQQDYSMRVWLDPEKMASRNLTADDVVTALKEQNIQVAAGQLGRPPAPPGLTFQYVLSTMGRLVEAEQFGRIVIKASGQGQYVYLRDIARIELGAKNLDTRCALDGKPSVGLAIFQLPGSNALETADHVRHKMEELKKRFPPGLRYAIVYDTTPFIEESVDEVYHALRDAVILVAIVVLFFLQDWRAMILPMIDVPVSLIGTLAVMFALGFTLNNLTLFGLVLAIGIVVDDAIVVLENIERWLAKGLDTKTATIKAMEEITGPIIAITLVLCSVLLPSAFLPGISGQFYRQFALTISSAMLISAINAMTMTPARAVMIFKKEEGQHEHKREALPWWGVGGIAGFLLVWLGGKLLPDFGPATNGHDLDTPVKGGIDWIGWAVTGALFLPGFVGGALVAKQVNAFLAVVFQAFNRGFDRVTELYGRAVGRTLRLSVLVLVIYVGLIGLTGVGFATTPTGFIPAQDKGYLLVNVQLPDSAALERCQAVMAKLERVALDTKGVAHTVTVPGQSFVLNAVSSNFGSMFVILKPFHDRHGADMYSDRIADVLRKRFYLAAPEAVVAVFGPPAVDGLGNTGGFKLMVEDRADAGLEVLQGQADNLAEAVNQAPGFVGVISTFRSNTPQFYIDIDRVKCKNLGVDMSSVFNALQVYLGGYYVNDFNRFGRTWQVNLQADASFRLKPEDLRQLKVRNRAGDMVPLGTVAAVRDSTGPVLITRYNMYPAATVTGANLPGFSSGQMIQSMEELSRDQLASSMAMEWTELTYLQILAGGAAVFAFLGAVTLVFLVLAAQYESYTMPLAVILVVPMCLLSAIAGIVWAGLDINIFVQVGFIVLVGLASKNAILIVEFARERVRGGLSPYEAAIDAARSRLRPIVMTSFAFILGVVPLVVSTGAGAEMRRTLGIAVFSGMLGVTAFGIFLTPLFYYVLTRGGKPQVPPQDAAGATPARSTAIQVARDHVV